MQHDVDTVSTTLAIHILGVNQAGQQDGNAGMCQGRTLPWLQDTKSANVWGAWHVTERDVIVLDEENKIVAIYNLTSHNLSDSTNYATLRGILIEAARDSAGIVVRPSLLDPWHRTRE